MRFQTALILFFIVLFSIPMYARMVEKEESFTIKAKTLSIELEVDGGEVEVRPSNDKRDCFINMIYPRDKCDVSIRYNDRRGQLDIVVDNEEWDMNGEDGERAPTIIVELPYGPEISMADDPIVSNDRDDDQLKQALLAAFGDDAIDLLDAAIDEDDALTEDHPDLDAAPELSGETGSRIDWMQQLTQSIYADRIDSDEEIRAVHRELRHLVFQIGGVQFAVPLTSVRHVERDPQVTALPRTPSWLRGVANFRGEIISVTDLRNLLELPGDRPNECERIVIVGDADTGLTTGLIVDTILGIRTADEDSAATSPATTYQEVAKSMVTIDQHPTCLVAVSQLFQSKRLASFSC